jgi:UPF0042 nucleotide-binding protein
VSDQVRVTDVLVITGMSGAGKSTAARALEDLGWYVVDNLPPQLIPGVIDLASTVEPPVRRVAVVVDVRGVFFRDLRAVLGDLAARGAHPRVLFVDATDEALVRRFESVRRPHPLQGSGRVLDGIHQERTALAELRSSAGTVIDSTRLNVHQLTNAVVGTFGDPDAPSLRLVLMSFGFKYGLPLDADHVADVRFIPNPFWVPELRSCTGLDDQVASYVLAQKGVDVWLERYAASLEPVLDGYRRENKRHATVAVGCTGGKHRSVTLSTALGRRLEQPGLAISTLHRDLGRE